MKFGKILLTAVIATCASSAVVAQDNWTGFYIGFNTGLAWTKSDVRTTVTDDGTGYFLASEVIAINDNARARVKPFGLTGGGTIGFNWQAGRMVFGLEGDYNHFNKDAERTVTFADPCGSGCIYTVMQRVNVKHLATLRARFGWANAHWFIYGTAGGVNAKVNYHNVFTDNFADAYEASWQSHSKNAFVWGAGAEVHFAKNWSVKTEYLHSNLGDMSGPGGLLTAYYPRQSFPSSKFTHSYDLSMDMFRCGVNFRF